MYKVQFYSRSRQIWRDYAPITHNTSVPEFTDENAAYDYMTDLMVEHPNDRFRVEEL